MTDWNTLDKLMAGKAPGSLVVERKPIDNELQKRFTPHFKFENFWYGITENDSMKSAAFGFGGNVPEWRPHVPPPKKVVRWQWAVRQVDLLWHVCSDLMTEEEAAIHLRRYPDRKKQDGPGWTFEEAPRQCEEMKRLWKKVETKMEGQHP